MLGYVFWHAPKEGVASPAYRDALSAFHRALNAHPPAGFRGSASFALSACPWLPAGEAFEDWYLVEDFAALGVLNEAAVAGPRGEPHQRAAALAGPGTGGLYLLNRAPSGSGVLSLLTAARWRWWFAKPEGRSYPDFHEELRTLPFLDRALVWQRQLTLGPALEYCTHGAAQPPPPARSPGEFIVASARVL
jgi:hypothetical protein